MSFSDWSTNAAANTNVGGINIGEGCPAPNLNNAQREMMAELRAAFSTALASFFAATDIPTALAALGALSKAGDTINGNLTRNGAGPHFYHAAGYSSAKVNIIAAGDALPAGADGDIVYRKS